MAHRFLGHAERAAAAMAIIARACQPTNHRPPKIDCRTCSHRVFLLSVPSKAQERIRRSACGVKRGFSLLVEKTAGGLSSRIPLAGDMVVLRLGLALGGFRQPRGKHAEYQCESNGERPHPIV